MVRMRRTWCALLDGHPAPQGVGRKSGRRAGGFLANASLAFLELAQCSPHAEPRCKLDGGVAVAVAVAVVVATGAAVARAIAWERPRPSLWRVSLKRCLLWCNIRAHARANKYAAVLSHKQSNAITQTNKQTPRYKHRFVPDMPYVQGNIPFGMERAYLEQHAGLHGISQVRLRVPPYRSNSIERRTPGNLQRFGS